MSKKIVNSNNNRWSQLRRIIFYGFFLWFVPALFSVIVWDTSTNQPVMGMLWFNSIIAIVWSLNFALVAFFYFKGIYENYKKIGLFAGIVWYIICILLDFLVTVVIFNMDISVFLPGILSNINNLIITTLIGFILGKKDLNESNGV